MPRRLEPGYLSSNEWSPTSLDLTSSKCSMCRDDVRGCDVGRHIELQRTPHRPAEHVRVSGALDSDHTADEPPPGRRGFAVAPEDPRGSSVDATEA